jgi:RNA polymerase sigma-70 factor (ECF subfamily)
VIGNFPAIGEKRVTEVGAELTGSVEARRAAFARLIDPQLDSAYRLAAYILGSEIEAEDAVQDAAAHAWQRLDTLRDPARFAAWFTRILVNGCRDRLRARRRQPASLPLFQAASPDPAFWTDERMSLLGAMGRLSAEHREVLALHYLADLPVADIAERTGARQGTVRSRLHYALRALRATYDAGLRTLGEDRP